MSAQNNTNTTNTTNTNSNQDIAGKEIAKAVDMALDAQKKGEGAQVIMSHAIYLRVCSGDLARHSLINYASDKMDKDKKSEYLNLFLAKNNKRCEQLLELLDKDSDAYATAGENKKADARNQMNAIKQMTRRALMTAAYLLDIKAEDVKITKANKLQYTAKLDGESERDIYAATQVEKMARSHFRPQPQKGTGNQTNAGQGAAAVDDASAAVASVPLATLCEMTAKRIRGIGDGKLNEKNKAAAQELLCELLALFAAKDKDATKIDGRKVQSIYKAAAHGKVA